jgi:hypothetical protein
MPNITDQNGNQRMTTRLEPSFWVKLAGLMLTITGGATMFGKWYVDLAVGGAIETHRIEMNQAMDREVASWWGSESAELRDSWRHEITEALLTHVSKGPHAGVKESLDSIQSEIRSIDKTVVRMEVTLNEIKNGKTGR